MIPESFIFEGKESYKAKKKSLPIGLSDYKKAASDYYYVDKTLLIKDFLDTKPQVSLFTRPRRFGKTLMMNILKVFFKKTDTDTSSYFLDKKINKCGNEYMKYQGKFLVIFLTFKDLKSKTWSETKEKIKKMISMEFLRHFELKNSNKLNEF